MHSAETHTTDTKAFDPKNLMPKDKDGFFEFGDQAAVCFQPVGFFKTYISPVRAGAACVWTRLGGLN